MQRGVEKKWFVKIAYVRITRIILKKYIYIDISYDGAAGKNATKQ